LSLSNCNGNLGGFIVCHTKLETLLQKLEQGSIESWENLHDEYRRLSVDYEEDARTFAWQLLGYLSQSLQQIVAFDAAYAAHMNMHFNSAAASYLSENHLSIAPKLFP